MKRSPIKRFNSARRKKRHEVCFGEQAKLCRRLLCAVPTCKRHGEPHHDPTRGAGGVDKDTVPLCREHHTIRHILGRHTFEERYAVSLREEARKLREKVQTCDDGTIRTTSQRNVR